MYKVEYRECSITDWYVKYFFTRRGALKFLNKNSTYLGGHYDEIAVYERDKTSTEFSYKKHKKISGWKLLTSHFS